MKKAGIVGYGRFGALLASLSKDYFEVFITESDSGRSEDAKTNGFKLLAFDDLSQVDFIFLAVPISDIEKVILELSSFVQPEQVVIDLCSVKVYPAKKMTEHLSNCQMIATHPMFGPDSAKQGLNGLQVAICPIKINNDNLKIIKNLWTSNGASVIETTPEAHDKDSVYSQAFTYTIAKLILGMNLHNITFKTRSFAAICEVARLSANDTEQLFHDMLFYNPYFREMKKELEGSFIKTGKILKSIETDQAKSNLF